MNKFKTISVSIVLSVLGLIAFYAISFIVAMVFAFLFSIIAAIPVLGTLVDWLFSIRGDTPDMLAILLAAIISYLVLMFLFKFLCKSLSTHRIAAILLGVYLIALNAVFLLINLVGDSSIYTNIIFIIAGLVMCFRNDS